MIRSHINAAGREAISRTVEQVFAEEQPRLLPPPLHSFRTDRIETVRSHKTIYVRFDLNDYSIPPEAVGHAR